MERQTGSETDRQSDRETDRQRDRKCLDYITVCHTGPVLRGSFYHVKTHVSLPNTKHQSLTGLGWLASHV